MSAPAPRGRDKTVCACVLFVTSEIRPSVNARSASQRWGLYRLCMGMLSLTSEELSDYGHVKTSTITLRRLLLTSVMLSGLCAYSFEFATHGCQKQCLCAEMQHVLTT